MFQKEYLKIFSKHKAINEKILNNNYSEDAIAPV